MGIEVEVYYASEVSVAAAAVSRTRLGGVLQHIGGVGELTKHRLEAISPIHLLIGGSPCNDLSAINRFPKDFYGMLSFHVFSSFILKLGTGFLDPKSQSRFFFDFVRVLEMLRTANGPKQHLFWLFENVASMPKHYRKIMSRYVDSNANFILFTTYCFTRYRHLGCQPAIIDAKHFSPQLRRRLFWGNIPGLFTINKEQYVGDAALTLETSLMPNSGRRATQDKVRTLTTNTNSLLQGRVENCSSSKDFSSLFPVRCAYGQSEKKSMDEKVKPGSSKSHPDQCSVRNVKYYSFE